MSAVVEGSGSAAQHLRAEPDQSLRTAERNPKTLRNWVGLLGGVAFTAQKPYPRSRTACRPSPDRNPLVDTVRPRPRTVKEESWGASWCPRYERRPGLG